MSPRLQGDTAKYSSLFLQNLEHPVSPALAPWSMAPARRGTGRAVEELWHCRENQGSQSLLTVGQTPLGCVWSCRSSSDGGRTAAVVCEQGLTNAFREGADPISTRRLSSRNHGLALRLSGGRFVQGVWHCEWTGTEFVSGWQKLLWSSS